MPTLFVPSELPDQKVWQDKGAKPVGIVKQSMHHWAHPAISYQVID